MTLLRPSESIDVTIVIVKFLLGTGHAFFGGAKIDVVLLVIAWHKKFLRFRFHSKRRKHSCQNGCRNKTAASMELFHSIPRLQPARSTGSRVYLVVPQVPLSHPRSADAAACGERFYVMPGTVAWEKKKPVQTLRKIDCLSECSYRLNSLG